MGAHSRRKGAQAERELAALARDHGFDSAERAGQMQAGDNRNDTPDVHSVGRLWLESKRYRRTPVNRFAREVLTVERPGYVSVLVYRDDRQPEPYAVLTLADLLKLERQALGKAPASPATGCREGCQCSERGGGVWAAMEHAGTPPPLAGGKLDGEPA